MPGARAGVNQYEENVSPALYNVANNVMHLSFLPITMNTGNDEDLTSKSSNPHYARRGPNRPLPLVKDHEDSRILESLTRYN